MIRRVPSDKRLKCDGPHAEHKVLLSAPSKRLARLCSHRGVLAETYVPDFRPSLAQ